MNNLLRWWDNSTPFERREGEVYYPRTRERMARRATATLVVEQVAGAFAALSPNNSEKINYLALDICIDISCGKIPPHSKVPAYGKNRIKALRILRGESSLEVLAGEKVRAFYSNIINPEKSELVVIDGHMRNLWAEERHPLKSKNSDIPLKQYREIAGDFRRAAFQIGIPAPAFQATLWLTWKRANNILYNPQCAFEF